MTSQFFSSCPSGASAGDYSKSLHNRVLLPRFFLTLSPNMATAFQRWLSPRPPQRTKNNDKPSWSHLGDAALYEPLSKPDGLWYIRETHHMENYFVRAGLSGPPL